jgi:hypothetical protein
MFHKASQPAKTRITYDVSVDRAALLIFGVARAFSRPAKLLPYQCHQTRRGVGLRSFPAPVAA